MEPDVIGGRYRVLTAVGRGGMGTVWLCRDETLARDVAVKQVGLLPGESVTDSARAMREARSTAALSHHNVVTVFDVVEEAGSIWLVMEHVPGRSLADLVREDGPLEPHRVADIGAQVADGLVSAHSAGTMHRDVKPGNVLVREDGVAKISDFGIARSAGDPALTQSGLLTGTPAYFSPELARGAAPGPASDVWALGATLYAAVEGRPPYQLSANPVAVLHDIATQQPPAPRHASFLEPVLLRMLDRDPQSRWSMADAADALRRLAEQHGTDETRPETLDLTPRPGRLPTPPPRPTSSAASSPSLRPQPRRRDGRPVVLGVAALLVLVVLGVGYALNRGNGSDGDRPAAGASAPSTSPRSSSGGPSGSAAPSSRSGSKAAFLRSYFAAAPGGTDTAWSRLGPAEQAQGRASYDGFWRGISSVDVADIRPVSGTDSVELTLTYHKTNGQTSTERQRLALVRSDDGGYLINRDDPVG